MFLDFIIVIDLKFFKGRDQIVDGAILGAQLLFLFLYDFLCLFEFCVKMIECSLVFWEESLLLLIFLL